MAFRGTGELSGRPIGQWAFREFADQETLAVATTTGDINAFNSAGTAENHLWLLKPNAANEKLEISASVNGFGKDEDIRAVRYVGNFAYIVTFKRTDPLFAFDLTDLAKPKLAGSLKVPGFSTYLHPMGTSRLVGLGYDAEDFGDAALTQGVQLSLFDTVKPENLQRLDVKIHGDRFSSSDAIHDHRAFFHDSVSGQFSFPLVERSSLSPVLFSGARFYNLKDDKLIEAGTATHKAWIPSECLGAFTQAQGWRSRFRSMDINRIYKINGMIYTLSRYGTKIHNANNLAEVTASVKFAGVENVCYMNSDDFDEFGDSSLPRRTD